MDKYHMPHRLDEPFRVFLLTVDELFVFITPFLLGFFVFDIPIISCMLGITLLILLRKFKGENGHYFIHYFCYWNLPPVVRFKCTPPSYKREFIG